MCLAHAGIELMTSRLPLSKTWLPRYMYSVEVMLCMGKSTSVDGLGRVTPAWTMLRRTGINRPRHMLAPGPGWTNLHVEHHSSCLLLLCSPAVHWRLSFTPTDGLVMMSP
jgi:hypothetical protein